MNRFTFFTFLALFTLIPFNTGATEKTREILRNDRGSTSFEIPLGWKTVENLYGLPWTLLSPDHTPGDPRFKEDNQARRSALAIIPTGKENILIDSPSAEKSQSALTESRKTEIEKSGGKVLEVFPYRYEKLADENIELHRTGLKFNLSGSTLIEHSFHVLCKNRLFMLKSMVSGEDEKNDGHVIEAIVRSMQCE